MNTHPQDSLASGARVLLCLSEGEGDGRWVTVDGTHVFIENGVVTKGPAHLVGKKESQLSQQQRKHGAGKGEVKSANLPSQDDGHSSHSVADDIDLDRTPDGYLLHGRAARSDLDTDNVLQATRNPNVAKEYAGATGSIFALKPNADARILDARDANELDRITAALKADHEDGSLSPHLDSLIETGGGADKFRDGFNPKNIVDSAENYDDRELAGWLYERFGFDGVETNDGHVVLNKTAYQAIRARRNPTKTLLAESRATVFASSDRGFADALTLGQGLPSSINGEPVKYFWKEALIPGDYLDAKGKPFVINAARIGRLHDNFHAAKAKGFLPRSPDGHTSSAKANLGYIIDARKNARGGLELMHQLIGEDAHRAAARNKSSICTVANATLADGTVFDELIDHNAICPDPQLTNLSDFQPMLAASRGATADVVFLSLAASPTEESPVDLTKLREAIGAPKDTTDDGVIQLAVTKLGETGSQLTLSRSAATDFETKFNTEKQRADGLNTQVLELSKLRPLTDEGLLNGHLTLKDGQADLLFSQGRMSAAQLKLYKDSIRENGKPAGLMLSASGAQGSPADFGLKLLELNASITGTNTDGQIMPDPNDPEGKLKPVTSERKAELLAHAGIAAPK